jgi:hypothetical protein
MNVHALKSVTPRYDAVEDRILLAINAGQDDAWACWLTRRMALGVLGRLNQYLDQTSAMAAKTPLEYRAEVVAMERQAAVAKTQKALSRVAGEQLAPLSAVGELAHELKLTPQDEGFLLSLKGHEGGQAQGTISRAELQTILLVIEQEVAKAGWREGPASVVPPSQADPSETKRRVN